MRLAVSNLAWPADQAARAIDLLAGLGVSGVEVAPTRLAPWEDLRVDLAEAHRRLLSDAGLEVSSMQALLYGRPDLLLLGDAAAFAGMAEHFRLLAGFGAALGAGVMVLGAPHNRRRGDLPADVAWALGRDRLQTLGAIVTAEGLTIGIEPVPALYGGDFLTNWRDVLAMVRDVDHVGVGVHLDTGCVALGGDRIEEAVAACSSRLVHFHAAQPDLADFAAPAESHAAAACGLRSVAYDRWLSIEMRQQAEDPIAAVETAVRNVMAIYGLALESS